MSHDDAFLRAIIENPDDDGPRLLYADWLDERGDPRGEFIRVQCALAGMDEYDPRRWDLMTRERELLAIHQQEWLDPLPDDLPYWKFRRGFLDWVEVDGNGVGGVTADLSQLSPVPGIR